MGAPATVAGWRAQLRDNIAHARRNLRLVLEEDGGGPGGSPSSCRREHQQLLQQQQQQLQLFSPSRRPWRYDAYSTTVSSWKAADLISSSPSSSLQEEQLAKLVAGLDDRGRNQGSPLEAERIQRLIADEMTSVKSELSSVRSELRNLASGQAQAASSASESLQLRESINQLERDVTFMRTTTEQTFATLSSELKQLQAFAMEAIKKLAAEAAEALRHAQMYKTQVAASQADRELLAKKSAECQRLRAELEQRLAQEAQNREEAEQLAAECHQLRANLSFMTMERSVDRKALEFKAAALEQLRADVHQSTADQQALAADAAEVDRLREALEQATKDRDKSAEALKAHVRNTEEQETRLRAALDEACANGHMVNERVREMETELQLLRTAAAQRLESEQQKPMPAPAPAPTPSVADQKLEKDIATLQSWFADIQKQLQDLRAARDQKPSAEEITALVTKIQQLAETESGIAAKLQLQQDFVASQETVLRPASDTIPSPAKSSPVVPEVVAEMPKTLRKKPAALAIPTSKAQIGATSLENVRLRSAAGHAGAAAAGHNFKPEIPLPKRKVVSPPLTDGDGRVLHILSNGKELYLEPVSVRAHFFEELAHTTGSDESAPSSPKKTACPSPSSWWKASGFTSPQVSAT